MRKARLALLTALLLVAALAATGASAAPGFQMPFPCNQTWTGSTRTDHNPQLSIDLNRTDDLYDPVVASAGGKVITVKDLGGTSYGKYVVIDHGSGWTTLYAHLNSFNVSVGQSVSMGTKIGTVGSTGGSTGPHLHYEQKLNGVVQKVVWNGTQALYYGAKSYTSKNSCTSTGVTGTVNTSGADLNVRSGPGTSYSVVRQVADGQQVTITCQVRGEAITGTYGTTSLWDKLAGGGYISDAYVYTGSDGQVAPTCP
ncbi:MAG TPA: peptidoglycan DD-metalloendopeptidase family protein [Symbiobacteriaceae bacterium]|nr:peptidoglycan DD-metalloendopeptidase family protein [Symbiobacteriaceae bacterium]